MMVSAFRISSFLSSQAVSTVRYAIRGHRSQVLSTYKGLTTIHLDYFIGDDGMGTGETLTH